jgi:SAM-dependent methyltransferase
MADCVELCIYNTESRNAIHNILKSNSTYICSEYFGTTHQSGSFVGAVMHQDLMTLSLETESVDLVISSDVFEHIPDPYKAHGQVFRVLRPGGRHVFTVPFYQTECLDELRAGFDLEGKLTHYKEPLFHGDPLREEGALVFTIFGLEMLVKLAKIGFRTNLWKLRNAGTGILGTNAIVFEASKLT